MTTVSVCGMVLLGRSGCADSLAQPLRRRSVRRASRRWARMWRGAHTTAHGDGRRVEQQLILDRYRPLEELGEGGYGTVVLAWDTRMQRRVAIKRMPLPLDSLGEPVPNPPGLAEARTAAMLNHPAIVTVYDFETDSDEAFLIMEHIDGASLETVLDDLGDALDLDETAAVFSAVADALDFAHDNGVLHLDIKPANVLVTRDGRVKVADFGMAAISTAMGHGASVGGTLGYMPLEQLEGMRVERGDRRVGARRARLRVPHRREPLRRRHASRPRSCGSRRSTRRCPASSRPRCRARSTTCCSPALGLRPADRYRSVAAFADALEPHLGDATLGRGSLAETRRGARRRRRRATRSALGLDQLGLWDRLGGRTGRMLLGAGGGGGVGLARVGGPVGDAARPARRARAPSALIALAGPARAVARHRARAGRVRDRAVRDRQLGARRRRRRRGRALVVVRGAQALRRRGDPARRARARRRAPRACDAAPRRLLAPGLRGRGGRARGRAALDARLGRVVRRAAVRVGRPARLRRPRARSPLVARRVARRVPQPGDLRRARRLARVGGGDVVVLGEGDAAVGDDRRGAREPRVRRRLRRSPTSRAWRSATARCGSRARLVVSLAASLTMVVLVAALGAPVRPEEDSEPE